MARLTKSRARSPLADGKVRFQWRHCFGTTGMFGIGLWGGNHEYLLEMSEAEARETVKMLEKLLHEQANRAETMDTR